MEDALAILTEKFVHAPVSDRTDQIAKRARDCGGRLRVGLVVR
jgi:hypothetical protein